LIGGLFVVNPEVETVVVRGSLKPTKIRRFRSAFEKARLNRPRDREGTKIEKNALRAN
jgi:hypothetical protein